MGSAVTIRVRKHREQLRAEGLKPVQIWVPDTRSASFRRKCERESAIAGQPIRVEAETLDWIAEVADTDGWV